MITQPLHSMQCTHSGSTGCDNRGAGHRIRPIQARVAAATPSKWVDGLITTVSADGWIGIRLVAHDNAHGAVDGDTVWVWNHADLTEHLATGDPVAVHSLYNVLASGRSRISVVRL